MSVPEHLANSRFPSGTGGRSSTLHLGRVCVCVCVCVFLSRWGLKPECTQTHGEFGDKLIHYTKCVSFVWKFCVMGRFRVSVCVIGWFRVRVVLGWFRVRVSVWWVGLGVGLVCVWVMVWFRVSVFIWWIGLGAGLVCVCVCVFVLGWFRGRVMGLFWGQVSFRGRVSVSMWDGLVLEGQNIEILQYNKKLYIERVSTKKENQSLCVCVFNHYLVTDKKT